MKEILFLSATFIIFLLVSLLFHQRMVDVATKWLFVYILAYFIAISLYFNLALRIHQTLRNNKIFLEFGHAEILLLELYVICYITAIGFIINVLRKRRKKYSS